MILELKDICKDYVQGKMIVPVLKNVQFSMEEGEYVAIMGPSGSGKTTLMNIVGCLDNLTSGSFILDGEDMSTCTDNQLSDIRLQKIGFVFQNFQLMPKESALENVALPLTYAGVPKKERRERAKEALTRVGLEDRVDFKPTQLSGGQKQRVAIARAIVNRPKILLADEPTGALDSKSGEQVMELFQSLNDEGVSILMITHSADIAGYAGRMVEIRDGILKEQHVNETGDQSEVVQLQEEPERLADAQQEEPERLTDAQSEGAEQSENDEQQSEEKLKAANKNQKTGG